jgi:Ion channel
MPPTASSSTRFAAITHRRFFLLFIFLCVTLVLYPFADSSHPSYYLFRIFGSSVILLSVYAISFRRGVVMFALVLAIPALIQHNFHLRADASRLALFGIVLSLVFDIVIIVAIFRRVFTARDPEAETIFGALCVYLLIGFSFANLYGIIAALQPGAFYFVPALNWHLTANRFDFLYFSFGAMTTLGSPGIIAISPQARAVALMEAICGILYLAVLISRLVGAYNRRLAQP